MKNISSEPANGGAATYIHWRCRRHYARIFIRWTSFTPPRETNAAP
jgi:hypothetical protein